MKDIAIASIKKMTLGGIVLRESAKEPSQSHCH